MKKLKNYFKMIITAVICFAMSLIPGKKAGKVMKNVFTDGQAVSDHTKKRKHATGNTGYVLQSFQSEAAAPISSRHRYFLKKVFLRRKGPGDKSPLCYESSG